MKIPAGSQCTPPVSSPTIPVDAMADKAERATLGGGDSLKLAKPMSEAEMQSALDDLNGVVAPGEVVRALACGEVALKNWEAVKGGKPQDAQVKAAWQDLLAAQGTVEELRATNPVLVQRIEAARKPKTSANMAGPGHGLAKFFSEAVAPFAKAVDQVFTAKPGTK